MSKTWCEIVTPRWECAGEGEGFCFVYPSSDRAGDCIRCCRPQLGQAEEWVVEQFAARGCGEHDVTIERGVDRVDGAREPSLRHDG